MVFITGSLNTNIKGQIVKKKSDTPHRQSHYEQTTKTTHFEHQMKWTFQMTNAVSVNLLNFSSLFIRSIEYLNKYAAWEREHGREEHTDEIANKLHSNHFSPETKFLQTEVLTNNQDCPLMSLNHLLNCDRLLFSC